MQCMKGCKLSAYFCNNTLTFSSTRFNEISVVKSILNTLSSIDSNEEFIVELIKACNGMIDPKDRNKFVNTVRLLANIAQLIKALMLSDS